MSVVLSGLSFLSNPSTPASKHRTRIAKHPTFSCNCSSDVNGSRRSDNQFAQLALVAVAAGVLTLGSVDPASAAKTGGRVGGQAFRSSTPRSSGSGPRINDSRTNVYINPPVAPPLVGGYGFGYGVPAPFYGGWGWSPFSFFAPGPAVAVGVGGGLDLFLVFVILGAISAVVRRFLGSRDEDDE